VATGKSVARHRRNQVVSRIRVANRDFALVVVCILMLQPLGARILVKRLPPPEQTRGGIYLLGREYPTLGRIEAIGDGRKATDQRREVLVGGNYAAFRTYEYIFPKSYGVTFASATSSTSTATQSAKN
jgi:co-chaperonin GroES (HSP10)